MTMTTVTFTAAEFEAQAARAVGIAEQAAQEADRLLILARARAAKAPRDFHTPGGASAEDMLAVMGSDSRSVYGALDYTRGARRATLDATDLTTAAQQADLAETHAKSAAFDAESMRRYLAYLPA